MTTTNEMQNITCAMKIVQKPRSSSVWLRKRVSSEAPSTISGAAIGRKMRKLIGARPRNWCRTSASAISVPRAVAVTLASTAIRSDVSSAERRPGTASQLTQLSNVKLCQT